MSVLPRNRDLVTRQVVAQSATIDPNAGDYNVPTGYIGIQVWVGTAGTLVFVGQNDVTFTLVGIPAGTMIQPGPFKMLDATGTDITSVVVGLATAQ